MTPEGSPTDPAGIPADRPSPIARRSLLFDATTLEQSMGLYLTATVFFRFINFGRIWLLTWYMSLEQMGLLNMILMVVSVLIPLSSMGLNEAVARYAPQYEQAGTLAAFVRRSFLLLGGITAAMTGLLILFAEPLSRAFFADEPAASGGMALFNAPSSLVALTAGVIALNVVYFYLLAVFKGLRMFRALSWLEIGHSLCFLAGSVLMILLRRLSAFDLTVVFGLSIILPVVLLGVGLWRRLQGWAGQHQSLGEARLSRRLLQYSVWMLLSGVAWQALQYYATWYLNRVQGSEPVAVFTTVQKIAQFILIGAVAVATVAMTTVTNTWESRGRQAAEAQLSLAFRGTGLGLFFVCAVLSLSRHWIMTVFRPDYAPGAAILPLLLCFSLLAGHLSFLPGQFNLREKTRYGFLCWAAGIVANALLAAWLAGPSGSAADRWIASKTLSRAGAWLGMLFGPPLDDSMGLHVAAWCAVLAMFFATGLCVVLLWMMRARLDRGMIIVLAASALLTMRDGLLMAGTVGLVMLALGTNLVFEKEERRRIWGYARESIRFIPMTRRRRPPG